MKKKVLIIGLLVFLVIVGVCSAFYFKEMTIEPDIVLVGEENIILNLGEEYKEAGYKASIKDKDCISLVMIDGSVDVNKVGTYKLTYSIVNEKNDKSKSVVRNVSVIDNVNPVITLKGNSEVILYVNEKYEDAGYEALDNYDGDISSKVQVIGSVDPSKVGEYELTYVINDEAGNKGEAKRKVIVKERPVVVKDDSTLNTSVRGLPVLMYHFFYDESKGETGNDANWMEVSDFEEQMKYLSDNNYYFPTWQEVEDFVDGKITLPEKSVVVTIDDGDITFINLAIPIIEKYNVKATSFAVTSWNGDWLPDMYASSHLDFQSHSHDAHRAGANGKGRLVNMTYEQALEDVSKSRDLIGGSTVFCYPFGHYNDTAISALKDAGYKLAFTTKGGRVYPGANKYLLPRVRMSKGISLESFKAKVK